MPAIAVTREGSGPELLLVHGGASPETTWRALRPLADRWTLVLAHRRGYPPSPPGRHDFDVDAADLAPLLDSRPHVLAHSYGALGALIAASSRPGAVGSLTLVEPPLFHLAAGDPDVEELRRMGDALLTEGLDADPVTLREFLRVAGAPGVPDDGPLPPHLVRSVERSHGGRLPDEARPDLRRLRDAGVPALVASGAHSEANERICDALAAELGGERLRLPGAGHFVHEAPAFAERLCSHLTAAERRDGERSS